jgi:hypothetical protein
MAVGPQAFIYHFEKHHEHPPPHKKTIISATYLTLNKIYFFFFLLKLNKCHAYANVFRFFLTIVLLDVSYMKQRNLIQ